MLQRGLLVGFLLVSLGVQYWAHATYKPSRSSMKEGAAAPAWSLEDMNGERVSSDKFRGRVVVLDFWASWCVPCRQEFEVLTKWWEKERASGLLDGVEFLAVNVGESAELVAQFMASNSVPFRIVRDEDSSVAKSFGVTGLPTLIMLDRDGRVAWVGVGYDPWVGASISDELKEIEKERAK